MTPEEAGMQATAQLGCIQQQQEICQTETAVEVEATRKGRKKACNSKGVYEKKYVCNGQRGLARAGTSARAAKRSTTAKSAANKDANRAGTLY
jgi:hypothetical protein